MPRRSVADGRGRESRAPGISTVLVPYVPVGTLGSYGDAPARAAFCVALGYR